MPMYDYRCRQCAASTSLRRLFTEMDDPAECKCGGSLQREFTPNGNIWVPLHFKAVHTGGVEGGHSWSDFHDETEKELAHMRRDADGNRIEVVRTSEWNSQPGVGTKMSPEEKQAQIAPALEKAYDAAWNDHHQITTRS